MKTTIKYPGGRHNAKAVKRAHDDVKRWLSPKQYKMTEAWFCHEWQVRRSLRRHIDVYKALHHYLAIAGIEGFPVCAFAHVALTRLVK